MTATAELWSALERLVGTRGATLVREDEDAIEAADDAVRTAQHEVKVLREAAALAVGRRAAAAVTARLAAAEQVAARALATHTKLTRRAVATGSLWEQLEAAIVSPDRAGASAKLARHERSVVDVELVEIHALILTTVRREVARRGERPRDEHASRRRPACLSQLANLVTSQRDPDWDVEWWAYRLESWARLLEAHLGTEQRATRQVRLRGTACPECNASSVPSEQDETVRVAALVVALVGGLPRDVTCEQCWSQWTQDQLADLGDYLKGTHP